MITLPALPALPGSLELWRDRRGRLSPTRIVTLALLAWPALLASVDAVRGALGGRPLNELIHRSGWWALVFLLVSLAITPLRRSTRLAKLIDVRRMIGVAAFVYAAAHVVLYMADEKWNLLKVVSEIVSRLYLTIGFVALLGLTALTITSNDTMVKRLGGINWRRLHMATYAIALLALVHFFQQTKADISQPTLYAGLFGWLMGYRLLARWRGDEALTPSALAGLALAVAALTFVGEAVGIGIAFKVSPLDILATAVDFEIGVRPGWWVLAAGLAVAGIDLARGWSERRSRPELAPALAQASSRGA